MIKFVRVDHRLLHGQVALSWFGATNANCILIANDSVPDDPIRKATIKMARPTGAKGSGAKLSSSERLDRRSKSLKPLIDSFWQWCDQAEALPKSRLGKALIYAQNQRKALNQILNFGEIDLSNNASERNMKSYVIGRKNWLFSTSPKGAEANAIWMSLIESAKANGLTPFKYLQDIIEKISKLPVFMKTEELEAYLPWNWQDESKPSIPAKMAVAK
ncbi:transposase [Liquorilactobacillus satsumensis]|uniref:IS66 family transposase n=2 Tax=Lactobacillaceae TaxID=33958 RepID=UPI0021C25BD0|nr:transposase [Liquorilactobacillus satsumensis]MCP9360873.1 transposase [Liquorilactobacillus satsumensis]